jgi:hypothetical protein
MKAMTQFEFMKVKEWLRELLAGHFAVYSTVAFHHQSNFRNERFYYETTPGNRSYGLRRDGGCVPAHRPSSGGYFRRHTNQRHRGF